MLELFIAVKKTPIRSASILLAALLLAGVLAPPAVAQKEQDGEKLFHLYCADCHGEKAVGQDPAWLSGGWREDGSRIAPALNGTAHAWHHEPELLYDYVKTGSVDPESPMPAFGDELDDAQVWAIIGYFQSFWPDKVRKIYVGRFPGALK